MKIFRIFISFLIIYMIVSTGLGGNRVQAADNPSLYYTQAELNNFKALKTAPSHSAIWSTLQTYASTHVNDAAPADFTGTGPWDAQWATAVRIRDYIENMVFVYHMTDNSTYAAAAERWMNAISTYTSWNDVVDADFTRCDMIKAACMGYTGLANYSTSANHTAQLAKLRLEASIEYADESHHDRIDYPNYRAYVSGALIPAGIATGNTTMETWANSWLNGALGTLGSDGAAYEGGNYANHMMNGMAYAIQAEIVKGGTNYLTTYSGFFSNHGLYVMETADYNGTRLVLEDTNPGYAMDYRNDAAFSFMYLLARSTSNVTLAPYIEWYAENYSNNKNIWDYIWKSPTLTASPTGLTGLPLYVSFPSMGYEFWRDGWNLSTDLLVVFKSGSSRGHSHADQNSFAIWNKGRMLTGGPGYTTSWDEYDETSAHNCILVDPVKKEYSWSGGQAQEPGDLESVPLGTKGIIQEHVSNNYYSYARGLVGSNLYTNNPSAHGSRYPTGDLGSWTRQITFVRNPYYLVIYDDVSDATAHEFDWCFNGKDNSNQGQSLLVNQSNNVMTFTVGAQTVETKILEPASYHYLTELDRGGNAGLDFYRAQIHPATNTNHAYFLNVLFPDASLKVAQAGITHVNQGNCAGTIVSHNGKKDLILFSRDGAPVSQYIELGGSYLSADGNPYTFNGTQVRANFNTYKVMRLEAATGGNHAPVLSSIGNKSVKEQQTLGFTVSATDPDSDPLTYSASNLPPGASFNSGNHTFSWTPNSGQVGTYPNVQFSVSDNGSLTDSENITITVTANSTPVLASIGNKTARVGSPLQFTISATDPDGDPLTYSASNLPPWASFNPATRAFSGTANQTGTYNNAHFEVSDGSLTDSENITITITTNQAPVLTNPGNKSVNEGAALTFTVSATDPDGDSLIYSANSLPSGATFTPASRTFSWTPASGQAGIYANVQFIASDSQLTDSENITITVNNANRSPVMSPIGNKSVTVGQLLTFTVSATDPDGDSLTYSATNTPAGASFNGTTRTFTWTPVSSQVGSYANVRFVASDGSILDAVYITITVNAASPGADVNNDGAVNILDMINTVQHWGASGANGWIPEDVNNDGKIDVLDITLIGQQWTG